MGVENPDINECAFKSTTPETTYFYFQTSAILSDGSGGRWGLSSKRLKVRLDSHIMAYLGEQTGSQIVNLVVPD